MSDPVTNVEIEDVLSSIRRLVSDEAREPLVRRPAADPAPVHEAPREGAGHQSATDPLVLRDADMATSTVAPFHADRFTGVESSEDEASFDADWVQPSAPEESVHAPESRKQVSDALVLTPALRVLEAEPSPSQDGGDAAEISSLGMEDAPLHSEPETQTEPEALDQGAAFDCADDESPTVAGFDGDQDHSAHEDQSAFGDAEVTHAPEAQSAPAPEDDMPQHVEENLTSFAADSSDEPEPQTAFEHSSHEDAHGGDASQFEAAEAQHHNAQHDTDAAPQAEMDPAKASQSEQDENARDHTQQDDPAPADEMQLRAGSIEAKIAELESLVGRVDDQFEPDGSRPRPADAIATTALPWEDSDVQRGTPAAIAQLTASEVHQTSHAADAPAQSEGVDAGESETQSAQLDVEALAFQQAHAAAVSQAQEALADDASAAFSDTGEAGAVLDEDALRELIAEIVRQELQGTLGERITRNVRKLVRREIYRAIAANDLG